MSELGRRRITNNCDTAMDNANNILYCDQSNLEQGFTIPWKTQVKLAATYPLPCFGIVANASYQGLPGYTPGRTTYSINKATKYTTCPPSPFPSGPDLQARLQYELVGSGFRVQGSGFRVRNVRARDPVFFQPANPPRVYKSSPR
jgi:hypothetical protein